MMNYADDIGCTEEGGRALLISDLRHACSMQATAGGRVVIKERKEGVI